MATIDTLKRLPGADRLRPLWRRLRNLTRPIWLPVKSRRTAALLDGYDRLHLGCGGIRLDGWANIDVEGRDTLIWDLRRPLPVAGPRIRFIYAEHFIEHISRSEALNLLRSLRAILVEGGVLRLSTPDLRYFAEAYLKGRIIRDPVYGWLPASPAEMLNDQMRLWGHCYLYDEPELRALLDDAGFSSIVRVDWRQSSFDDLCGLESRADMGDLIVEAS